MDGIPYTIEAREDTGLYNAKFGIWLFLASEVMLFGSLFASYIMMRVTAAPGTWPIGSTILNVPIGTLNTVILISSSLTMILSWAALKEKNFVKHKIFLALTILCALVFLGIKYTEYMTKFGHHLFPQTSTYMAIYFTMTGLHACHILGGVIVLSYFLGPGALMWKKEPERFTNRIEVAGLYWHFVDLVWIFLFPTLYLL